MVKLKKELTKFQKFKLILVYNIGGLIFTSVASIKLFLTLFTLNEETARGIILQYDDAANVALDGESDVKISTRLYINFIKKPDSKKAQLQMAFVDKLFYLVNGELEHCRHSYNYDLLRGSVGRIDLTK